MKKKEKEIIENGNNTNTSPTDIKGKDVYQANQTNSGAGGSQIKEGSNLLPEEAQKVPNQASKNEEQENNSNQKNKP